MRRERTAVERESKQGLRSGDVVEVRPAGEILATLDESGCLDAVPFMPEMLQHVGKRFTVSKRVEKICDTVHFTGSRRMHDTVFLEDLRCDGSAHGDCHAGCRVYWKEAWLRRVDPGTPADAVPENRSRPALEQLSRKNTKQLRVLDGEEVEVYRCQATEAFTATPERLRTLDPKHYVRELVVGNVGPWRWLRVMVHAFFREIAYKVGLIGMVPVRNTGPRREPEPLGLEPGDWVQVKSRDEIKPSLDGKGYTRGLSFAWEMTPYCGGTYRVQKRVERIIDETTGKMLDFKTDSVILEGVVCTGECSVGRWFCARHIYPYWREAWLRRADPPR
jgi:hypothetical protein